MSARSHRNELREMRVGSSYITPRLIPEASRIFSLRGIGSAEINSQGNMAKKKSHMLDQTIMPVSSRTFDLDAWKEGQYYLQDQHS